MFFHFTYAVGYVPLKPLFRITGITHLDMSVICVKNDLIVLQEASVLLFIEVSRARGLVTTLFEIKKGFSHQVMLLCVFCFYLKS